MHRPVIGGTHGMVAAAHPLPALAGLRVLQDGGNAVDAMVATNAVLAVTQPQLCGIGGDLFALFYDAQRREVTHLNGSGRSAGAATIERLRGMGHETLPTRGALSISVPGCVDAWEEALARYGTRPLADLLAPAIAYAEEGLVATHKFSQAIATGLRVYAEQPTWAANFAPDGRAPAPGGLYRQPALAATLRHIAEGGRAAYYRGELARRLVAGIRAAGGLLDERDFAEHRADWSEPLRASYRGRTIYTTPPNSQGLVALLALNILDGFDLPDAGFQSPRALHLTVEALKLAYVERDRHITDPAFADIPVADLLAPAWADEARRRIDPRRARPAEAPAAPNPRGDTTYFAVADGAGNLVSCIQSNYQGFGSGVVVDGVAFQNRGAYFSLDPNHPNRLEPRKRTMHTLMASLVFEDDRPLLVSGSMGGDAQPAINIQLISHLLDFGRNVQDAIEDPRHYYSQPRAGARGPLYLEPRYPDGVVEALRDLGHRVEPVDPWSSLMGHAQGIAIAHGAPGDPPALLGGADPRGDGYAAGW